MHRSKLWLCCFTLCLVACTEISSASAEVHYVVPDNSNKTDASCHTLDYYGAHRTKYFVSDSTFLFLPGEHRLYNRTNITVQDASRISLIAVNYSECGYNHVDGEVPVINCNGCQAGFSFANVSDLVIRGITIINCGQVVYTTRHRYHNHTYTDAWSAALSLRSVTNFKLSDSNISHSHGYGIYAHGVYGNSSIEGCTLKENRGVPQKYFDLHGGNMALNYNKSCPNVSHFTISRSTIVDGYSVAYAGGLDLVLYCDVGAIQFELNQVNMSNNKGSGNANSSSNIGVQLLTFPDRTHPNRIRFYECHISNTDFQTGNAMHVNIYINSSYQQTWNKTKTVDVFEVIGSHFSNNTSWSAGSAVEIRLYDSAHLARNQVGIVFKETHFHNNRLRAGTLQQSSGIAVDIVLFRVGRNELHSVPQFQTTFTSCNFTGNYILNHPSIWSGVLYVEEHSNIVLENCIFSDNNCTGIAAVHSYLCFRGDNTIARNSAVSGGGLLLADNSVMLLIENSTLNITHNTANETGGGIYAEYGSTSAIPLCFFQFETSTLLSDERRKTIRVNVLNNTANSGTAVYGGHVDDCYFLVDNTPWINKHLLSQKSGQIFNGTFNYKNTDRTAISSDAVRVCFCENDTAACDVKTKKLRKSPGETFSISATVVGQRAGKTSGFIVAQFFTDRDIHVGGDEQTRHVNLSCAQLTYTIHSNREDFSTNLSLNVPESTYKLEYPIIELNITPCPLAFKLDRGDSQCSCISKTLDCYPENRTIFRPVGMWIGYNKPNNSHIPTNESHDISVKNCPHLYCTPTPSYIVAYPNHIDQDSQCYFDRTGPVCGQCPPHLSIVFGTPRCIDCSNHSSWWAVFGIICAFALAGVLLVVFLIACNFTVTQGTINGFILYANIVEASQDTYFPLKQHSMQDRLEYKFLRVFIAWLNLDIGIEVCFFNGMRTFGKTFLQFTFPIYIWLITGLLIWLSRRYRIVTRVMKNNGTKVLATLILLSYAKLIRSIRTCMSSVTFGTEIFWHYDASEKFFYGKHILLFLTATSFVVLLLPYTLALLFIKHLPRLTSLRMFHWLHKLKPFFDAYTGPYKDQYRFWVGFQLLIRIFILCCSTLKINNTLLLLQIIGACSLLLSANYFYGSGVYKKRSVNIIEALLLLNLIFWSMLSIYHQDKQDLVRNLVYVFVGLAFLQFCVVIACFHIYKPTCYLRLQERFIRRVKHTKMWRYFQRNNERVCLLEDSDIPDPADYKELSNHTSSSFHSATNKVLS